MQKPIVYITGGLSGIGKELSIQYLKQGHKVVVINRKYDPDRELEGISYFYADVIEKDDLFQVIDKAVTEVGTPDILINSAGVLEAGTLLEQADFIFKNVIMVNVLGSKNVVKACLPHMKEGGHIVFISSLAGLVGNYAYSAYCASKYAVIGMAECLRIELKPKKIDVSVICPGEVNTPMVYRERETMDPVTAKLKEFPGTLSVESVVKKMMPGIKRRKFMIVPGFMPKLTALLSRFLPAIARLIVDLKVKNQLKLVAKIKQ